jgi:hypothetical protein
MPALYYRHINKINGENETLIDQEKDGERQKY